MTVDWHQAIGRLREQRERLAVAEDRVLLLLELLVQRGQEGEPGTALVSLDGSSTVFPISEAMAEEFQKANPGVRVTVGVSGTGGGFQKFCRAETDISDASRPIKAAEIVFGRFATLGGEIKHIDVPNQTLTIYDLSTKKNVTVQVSREARMTRLAGGPGGGAPRGPGVVRNPCPRAWAWRQFRDGA